MGYKQKILELSAIGKSYRQIESALGCSRGNISYHLGSGQKLKTNIRRIKHIKHHTYIKKTDNFINIKHKLSYNKLNTQSSYRIINRKILDFFKDRKTKKYMKQLFTYQDVISKFGEHPRCYLTGDQINTNYSRSFHFDHKVPVSKGGTNTIDNLGICTADANHAKFDKTEDEFVELCKKVLLTHGYTVVKQDIH